MGFFTRKKKEGPKPAPIEVKKIQRPTDAYRARLFKSKGIPYISVAEADSDDDVKYRRVDRNGFELVFTDK